MTNVPIIIERLSVVSAEYRINYSMPQAGRVRQLAGYETIQRRLSQSIKGNATGLQPIIIKLKQRHP